jgi:hypothetical protein
MFIGGGVYQRPDDTNVGKRVSDFEFVSVMNYYSDSIGLAWHCSLVFS